MKKIKYQKCQKKNVLICLTVARNITANVPSISAVATTQNKITNEKQILKL